MSVLAKGDEKAIRRAMSEMPFGARLTPPARYPDVGLTGEEVAHYLQRLGETLRYHAKICNERDLDLGVLQTQQKHIGRFLRKALEETNEA